MDAKDERAQNLIGLSADAATQRASRELDLGEIENALADARLALKYRPEHEEARQLSLRIGERLFSEARVHYSKNEYPQLIKKVKEVIRIIPSDVAASDLLLRTNTELLTQADEFFISKKYYDALEKVRLALQVDPTNTRALRLFNQIVLYIETPEIRLRGITKFGSGLYAVVQLPGSNQTIYVKKGESVRNFKLVDIDPIAKTAKFIQIYTKSEFVIPLLKPE
jgi:tetratricopeptide (TPR) repeat protein